LTFQRSSPSTYSRPASAKDSGRPGRLGPAATRASVCGQVNPHAPPRSRARGVPAQPGIPTAILAGAGVILIARAASALQCIEQLEVRSTIRVAQHPEGGKRYTHQVPKLPNQVAKNKRRGARNTFRGVKMTGPNPKLSSPCRCFRVPFWRTASWCFATSCRSGRRAAPATPRRRRSIEGGSRSDPIRARFSQNHIVFTNEMVGPISEGVGPFL
jgi:hypothetical protein